MIGPSCTYKNKAQPSDKEMAKVKNMFDFVSKLVDSKTQLRAVLLQNLMTHHSPPGIILGPRLACSVL